MKFFFIFASLLFSFQAFAIQTVICTPAKNPDISVVVTFYKDINPANPFIGTYNWGATLKISQSSTKKSYENKGVRITPEIYYSDINLRGDAEGVYLRLYPHFDIHNNFENYTGQLFVNDLNVKAYFNFTDNNSIPGLRCK